MPYCYYCKINYDNGYCCNFSHSGLACTREKGHKGDHVACGVYKCNMKRWPQKKTKPTGGKNG